MLKLLVSAYRLNKKFLETYVKIAYGGNITLDSRLH